MTEIVVNNSTFQVQPFVRYKEDRLKGKLILSEKELSSVDMAIVKIKPGSMNVGGIARIPLVEIWGFVVDNPDKCVLSTLIALRFDLETPDFEEIYHLHFLPFHTDTREVFKLHSTARNPKNKFEKYALEVAQDINQSQINFCYDENLKNVTI
ncbi:MULTISPECIES: hypothetical protein [unclassified Microcoleus]|uniref:hypothetical protein n=1 Tax=unclassified Microcoleus TaxID=2642155 RepID=UPI002FD46653